jgi:subtilisin family serine protease
LNEGLALPGIAKHSTGRGVRVALLDTGVNFKHPHLGRLGTSVVVEREAGTLVEAPDREGDRVGHGTACAALLVLLAPDVELISVRVTDARPSTDAERLAYAVRVAASLGADLLAIPLGTPNPNPELELAISLVLEQGLVVVAARPGPMVYPAAYPGVLGVSHRDGLDVAWQDGGWWAEGRARPAPGGPARNFYGPSLAVARLAAAFARFREESGASGSELPLGFQKALSVL